jgi:hypothetical protein
MSSPGLQPPHPPQRDLLPAVTHPTEFKFRFPQDWEITILTEDGTWWAKKDTRILTARTEGGLFALVMDSERRRAVATC